MGGGVMKRLFKFGGTAAHLVLVVGDAGAVLAHFQGREVIDALFVSAEAGEEGLESLRAYLAAVPAAPIIVLLDVLEQMFREDVLPKVGPLDEPKILRRRLELAFPAERLTSSIFLGRDAGGGRRVLLVAVPVSPLIEGWTAFLETLPNPVTDYRLLPLESVDLMQGLVAAPETDQKIWRVLVCEDACGGFRQIIERDGHLVVTRLTHFPEGSHPESLAAGLERELRSSISYIKRHGYAEDDCLDVVVLAAPALCEALRHRESPATRLTVMTPAEAGRRLGVGRVGAAESGFADILHAAWTLRHRRARLRLLPPTLERRRRRKRTLRQSIWGLAALTALTMLTAYAQTSAYSRLGDALDAARLRSTGLELRLRTLRARVKGLPVSPEAMRKVVDSRGAYAKDTVDLNGFLAPLSGALGPDLRVSELHYADLGNVESQTGAGRPAPGRRGAEPALLQKPRPVEISMAVAVDFSGITSLEAMQSAGRTLVKAMAAAYPGHDVKIEKMPVDILPGQVLEGGVGRDGGPGTQRNPNALLVIGKEEGGHGG